jgi:hypothetical protein
MSSKNDRSAGRRGMTNEAHKHTIAQDTSDVLGLLLLNDTY